MKKKTLVNLVLNLTLKSVLNCQSGEKMLAHLFVIPNDLHKNNLDIFHFWVLSNLSAFVCRFNTN